MRLIPLFNHLLITQAFSSEPKELFIPRQWSTEVHLSYLAQREQFIRLMGTEIKGRIPFNSLLKKMGLWRRKIAMESDEEHATKFGCLRTKGANSLFSHLCLGCSDEVYLRAAQILDKTPKYEDPFWDNYKYFKMRYCQYFGIINNESIPLTRICHLQTKLSENYGDFFHFWGADPNKAMVWVHTETKYLDKVIRYLGELYEKILDSPDDDFFVSLAHWNWWYTPATPFYRGSAAIGEIFVLSILKSKDISLKIKHKLLLDVEGLLEPNLELYTINYPKFFEVM